MKKPLPEIVFDPSVPDGQVQLVQNGKVLATIDNIGTSDETIRDAAEVCETCGGTVRVGDWPFCKGDPSAHVPEGRGGLAPWKPYYDDHVAPPPNPGEKTGFSNPHLPTYVPGKGYEIRHRDDRRRLMKINRMEER